MDKQADLAAQLVFIGLGMWAHAGFGILAIEYFQTKYNTLFSLEVKWKYSIILSGNEQKKCSLDVNLYIFCTLNNLEK